MRLQHRRWISATWGTSEKNRKAKFYAITAAGRRQLAREVDTWDRLASVIARLRSAEHGVTCGRDCRPSSRGWCSRWPGVASTTTPASRSTPISTC